LPTKLLLAVFLTVSCFGQTIHHWGVTGQSLSQGFNGDPALTTTQPFANLSLNESFGFPQGTSLVSLIESGTETVQSAMGNQITSMTAANAYVAAVTRYGQNAASYTEINKGQASYTRGQTEFSNGQAAAALLGRGYVISGIAVLHGETDLANGVSATTYKAYMVQFQADHQADAQVMTSQTTAVPMLLNQPSSWYAAASRSTPTTSGGVDSTPLGIWQAARDNPTSIFLVQPNYYLPYGVDGLHLTNAGYRRSGEQFGKAARSIESGVRWYPLAPQSITLSGSTVTLVLRTPVQPVVLDTTLMTDSGAGKGFEWFDDAGTPVTVTGVTVASGNTLTITLSGAPTGTAGSQRLRYAWTGAALAGTADAAHGNVRDSDTTVGSSSGATLRNWLITFSEAPGFRWRITGLKLPGLIG
jgi:hypothetical protein